VAQLYYKIVSYRKFFRQTEAILWSSTGISAYWTLKQLYVAAETSIYLIFWTLSLKSGVWILLCWRKLYRPRVESTKDHPYISGRSLAWFPTLLNYARCLHLLLLQTFWQLLDPRKEIASLHVWSQWFRNNETLKSIWENIDTSRRKWSYLRRLVVLNKATKRPFGRAQSAVQHMYIHLPLLIFLFQATTDFKSSALWTTTFSDRVFKNQSESYSR